MERKRNLAVGIGEVLWDILPDGREPGGAPANFAYHVSRFGIDSVVVSAVGHDVSGDEMRRCLMERNVNALLEEVDYPTGTVNVDVDGDGIPHYRIMENVAWDNIPFSERISSLADRVCAVCFGTLAQRSEVSRSTVAAFLDSVADAEGVYRIFDVNLRQDFYSEGVLRDSLRRCNVLKLNDEELPVICRMTGLGDVDPESCFGNDGDRFCRSLLEEFGISIVILTCGARGSRVYTRDDLSVLETPAVKVADTVGAGDSFTASFVAALLKGRTVREAHRIAVDVSAYVCTQSGAMPVLPSELVDAAVGRTVRIGKREVDPKTTSRAAAFELWMRAPMPMVTFFRTLDVGRLVRAGRKKGMKFNMLMCWCIGKAASGIKEFYMLPEGDRLMQYDSIAVNTIVENIEGEVSSCDVPFSEDLDRFNEDYLRLTGEVARSCVNHDLTESMVIGTSALVKYRIDGAVGMYSGIFNNPFMIWGRYRRKLFRTVLSVSFQFHHTQMDGAHAALFLDRLQEEIMKVRV